VVPGQEDGDATAPTVFGAVDPSGHLAETFPTSLSEVPTSSPSQFPGVNGQVDYSEGIDVGYRWYDANNVTPLSPFGFGLSYTTFAFSDLAVTPSQLQNTVSGPGASDCGCNGQGSDLVTVSAKVTNTGKVAGSDVVQLYLGDPASAGQPPRQLEDFQRVLLQPGQSATVHFTPDGHALSYRDDAANGWVVPDGTFTVYLGDSSALANLPLQGSFTVTKSVGARYAALTATATTVAPSRLSQLPLSS
jgi:beta-glucosidase